MTIQTLTDMVWALGYAIKIIIYDPKLQIGQNFQPAMSDSGPGPIIETTPPEAPGQQSLFPIPTPA